MFFKKQTEYGIQALLLFASMEKGTIWTANEIARKLNLPKEFISKILQTLSREGIINSKRGKGGGFSLGIDTKNVTLLQIIIALEQTVDLNRCLFGFNLCDSNNSCPLHKKWSELRNEFMVKILNETLEKIHSYNLYKLME